MENLRKLREEAHKSQQYLAMEFGVSQASISDYELGNSVPSRDVLFKIAAYFDCSIDYLFGLSETKKPAYDPSIGNLTVWEAALIRKTRRLSEFDLGRISGMIDQLLDGRE